MRFSIVENVRTPSDIVLVTSRGLQLPYRKKYKKTVCFYPDIEISRIFPYIYGGMPDLNGHCHTSLIRHSEISTPGWRCRGLGFTYSLRCHCAGVCHIPANARQHRLGD